MAKSLRLPKYKQWEHINNNNPLYTLSACSFWRIFSRALFSSAFSASRKAKTLQEVTRKFILSNKEFSTMHWSLKQYWMNGKKTAGEN